MRKKYYTVYKITNLITLMYYVGMHETFNLDDGYTGSGKRIKNAVKKYGKHNFKREILKIHDNRQSMIDHEKEIVTVEFCLLDETYNIEPGGTGGWHHVNTTGKNTYEGYEKNLLTGKALMDRMKADGRYEDYIETMRERVRVARTGTRWITNGEITKQIESTDPIPPGFEYGRKLL